MAHKNPRDICLRCGQGPKWIKARGLCDSCYMAVKGSGSLDLWPRRNEMERRRSMDGYCHCFSPIPHRIGIFNAVECLKCRMKLPDER